MTLVKLAKSDRACSAALLVAQAWLFLFDSHPVRLTSLSDDFHALCLLRTHQYGLEVYQCAGRLSTTPEFMHAALLMLTLSLNQALQNTLTQAPKHTLVRCNMRDL